MMFKYVLLFLGVVGFANAGYLQAENRSIAIERGLYPRLNEKSWSQVLEEDMQKWSSPRTINLLVQPVFSPNWIYVNPSMTVSRRHVMENVSTTDAEKREKANSQEDLVVQFAFDDPVFVPDFRLTNLSLEENRYPVVRADYFANDVYYEIEYMATALDAQQTLLCVNVSVKNEGEHEREVHVRTKVGYYPENKQFDYHYIPFYWNAAKWLPYEDVGMRDGQIYKKDQVIGEVIPGQMHVAWEESKHCTDAQYEAILYPQVWYGSGYALPEFRLRDIQDVIHASQSLLPGTTTSFSIKLLLDEKHIQPSHTDAMGKLSPDDIKQKALDGFKQQLDGQRLSVEFMSRQWDDILTALQLNILQLLVKYPDKEVYMPTQGGCSERFFVWVFEAVQMLRPMLRTGQFEPVKKALDYIFALQDAGVPPVGRFTTTEGAIGTTGPRWANTTGMALALACDYYLYSKDRAFIEQYQDKILKALHWIAGEVKATRVMNPDGTRPLTYGLMPFAVASDGDQGYFVSATDIFSYFGFEKSVRLLETLKHPEAVEMRKELDQYKADLLVAIGHLARPDGYIDRKLVIGNDKNQEAVKFTNTDIMAPIATVGIMDPKSDVFQKYIRYYENRVAEDYFMGQMDRDIFYMIQCERYWQPIYLMLGEWKKSFMTLQTCLKYGMTQDTHQTQERFDRRNSAFAPWQPNGSGNGGVLEMILNSFYFEESEMATVLGGVPFAYLLANKVTSIKNLYTLRGIVDIKVEVIDDNRCRLVISSDQPLPQRIRIPEYLNPRPENASVRSIQEGLFECKKTIQQISFILSGSDV